MNTFWKDSLAIFSSHCLNPIYGKIRLLSLKDSLYEITKTKGTRNILPAEGHLGVAGTSRALPVRFQAYNYAEVRTPILEHYGLSVALSGGYNRYRNQNMQFYVQGDRHITLRQKSTWCSVPKKVNSS